ncbi:MAG: hypothetical protein WAR37_00600 [Candidatus Microsaccharimonas sp.]
MNAPTQKTVLKTWQISAMILLVALVMTNIFWGNAYSILMGTVDRQNAAITDLTQPVKSTPDTEIDSSGAVDTIRTDPVLIDANGKSIADLQAYLTSPERAAKYVDMPQAGKLIAKSLNNGDFGEPYRYNSMKTDLQPGYTGEGGISLASDDMLPPGQIRQSPWAWVWWNSDGTISDKPITQLGIPNCDTPEDTYVMLFGPNEYEPYWQSLRIIDDEQFTNTSAYNLESYGGWGSEVLGNEFTPSTLVRFQQLDDEIVAQLDANMTSCYGSDWRNL